MPPAVDDRAVGADELELVVDRRDVAGGHAELERMPLIGQRAFRCPSLNVRRAARTSLSDADVQR